MYFAYEKGCTKNAQWPLCAWKRHHFHASNGYQSQRIDNKMATFDSAILHEQGGLVYTLHKQTNQLNSRPLVAPSRSMSRPDSSPFRSLFTHLLNLVQPFFIGSQLCHECLVFQPFAVQVSGFIIRHVLCCQHLLINPEGQLKNKQKNATPWSGYRQTLPTLIAGQLRRHGARKSMDQGRRDHAPWKDGTGTDRQTPSLEYGSH